MLSYPPEHRDIVKELLQGKFIVDDTPFFAVLHEKRAFYELFFKATYGYDLEDNGECYYLTSQATTENGSRDLLLFLAVLCYEYHNRGKDIVYKMSEGTFFVNEVVQYVEGSSQKGVLKKTQVMDHKNHKLEVLGFLDYWEKRRVIAYTNNAHTHFAFKKPINVFLDTAYALYEDYLAEKRDREDGGDLV